MTTMGCAKAGGKETLASWSFVRSCHERWGFAGKPESVTGNCGEAQMGSGNFVASGAFDFRRELGKHCHTIVGQAGWSDCDFEFDFRENWGNIGIWLTVGRAGSLKQLILVHKQAERSWATERKKSRERNMMISSRVYLIVLYSSYHHSSHMLYRHAMHPQKVSPNADQCISSCIPFEDENRTMRLAIPP